MANLYNRYLRTRKALSILGNVVRCLLLLITVVAVGTFYVWRSHTAVVEHAETTITDIYMNGYLMKLDEAMEPFRQKDFPEASKSLQSFLSEMGEVRKQDTNAPIYTMTLERLLHSLRSTNNREAALATAKALVDFDGNNHLHWEHYARELKANNKKEEMIKALYKAFLIAPPNTAIAKELAGYLYEAGRVQDARKVADRYLNGPLYGKFSLFWATEKKGFSAENQSDSIIKVFLQDTEYDFNFTVQSDKVKEVKLRLPYSLKTVNISIISIFAYTGQGVENIELKLLKAEGLRDMTETGLGRYLITGARPSLLLKIPEKLRNRTIKSLTLRCVFKASEQELRSYL